MFHQEKLTCPFTGEKFIGTFNNDNTISIMNPITHASYNFKIHGNAITIPLSMFEYIETITPKEAENLLDISRQRMNKIIKDNIIPTYQLNNKKVMRLSDVLRYKQLRKAGRPTKDE